MKKSVFLLVVFALMIVTTLAFPAASFADDGKKPNKVRWYDNTKLVESARIIKSAVPKLLDQYSPGFGKMTQVATAPYYCVGWEIGRATAIRDIGVDPGPCYKNIHNFK
jgi:hypothetical protein